MSAHLSRRVLAELIGTALLVFFGAGSVVAAIIAGNGRLDYAALGFVGLTFGLVIAIAVYGFGTTSGAHINPAVSIALAAVRRFPWREVPAYIAAQLVGGVLGGLLIIAVFGPRATEIGGVGLTAVNPGASYGRGVVAELIGTFLLLLAIMALAVDRRAPPGPSGLVIGLAVATGIFVVGPITGGSFNPARTFGPYVANSIFGGVTPWRQFWVYVVGPVAGAVLAAFAYVAVARPVREVPAEAAQGAAGEIEGRRLPTGEVPTEAAQGTAGEIEGRRAPADPVERPDGPRDERG
ncbi:MIP family channel protein [Planosporangium thailandense]|uniref:MIP family channel protein n=1 Tax=Planosporangium thailandense TaxID=765197 RepID=A0ABX0XRQ8_9ACTN|nr:MIP family channel protein [Planosporangium thailandense]NJC68516.1 MIP family channel protein [Planosporangium thailandense]